MQDIGQNFRGSCDNGHASFRKLFKGHVWTVSGNMHAKSAALTILELSGLMLKNLGENVTIATSPFRKILMGHVQTVPGNIHVKYEVRSFNHFRAISI